MEIGSRWQRISQSQKEHYKKLAEEQQRQYKVHLDLWVKVRENKGPGREREAGGQAGGRAGTQAAVGHGSRGTQKSCRRVGPEDFKAEPLLHSRQVDCRLSHPVRTRRLWGLSRQAVSTALVERSDLSRENCLSLR